MSVSRRWAAGLLLACLFGGCATVAPPGENAHAAAERLLVTLDSTNTNYWQRFARDMQDAFELRIVGSWKMVSLSEQCLIFELPGGTSAAEMVGKLERDPRVTLAQPVERYRVLGDEWNDPYANLQHGLAELHLAEVHHRTRGAGVRIALIDSGVDVDHPDLEGRVELARNFVTPGAQGSTPDLHGTAVAGVLAAVANNGIGIVGTAPSARLLALKACWHEPPDSRVAACDSYTLALALDFAVSSGADILNLSLSGPPDRLLTRLLDEAARRGILIVAAVEPATVGFPASHPAALAVAGAAGTEEHEPSSVLIAPANEILTTTPGGGYDFFSGDSFAAAYVSGIGALLLAAQPGLPPQELRDLLRRTAHAGGSSAPARGARVDPCAALAELVLEPLCGEPNRRPAAP